MNRPKPSPDFIVEYLQEHHANLWKEINDEFEKNRYQYLNERIDNLTNEIISWKYRYWTLYERFYTPNSETPVLSNFSQIKAWYSAAKGHYQ